MTTSTDTPTNAAPQLPSATKPPLQIVGWLLTYRDGSSEFLAGATRPSLYGPDCEEIAAVVLACDAAHAAAQQAQRIADLERHISSLVSESEAKIPAMQAAFEERLTLDRANRLLVAKNAELEAERNELIDQRDRGDAQNDMLLAELRQVNTERDELRARLAEIETQEPVALVETSGDQGAGIGWSGAAQPVGAKLYASPVPAQAVPMSDEQRQGITLNAAQLRNALEFIAPDFDSDADQHKSEVTICWREAGAVVDDDGKPEPAGYVAWLSDYPEEGCIPLLESFETAAPEAAR